MAILASVYSGKILLEKIIMPFQVVTSTTRKTFNIEYKTKRPENIM